MFQFNFNAKEQQTLDDINAKFDQAYSENAHLEIQSDALNFWNYLVKCEQLLASGSFVEDEYHHDMENVLSLYVLNELIDKGHLTSTIRQFQLPSSSITKEQLERDWNVAGCTTGDGTLYAISKYCQLDPLWTAVLLYYFYYKMFTSKVHPFVLPALNLSNQTPPSGPEKATIAIIGDWGTGPWSDGQKKLDPSQLVINAVKDVNPDIVVHLGDVYYAGTTREEQDNMLDSLMKNYNGQIFTMNSNHEMYDGANGLMGTTLKDPRFTHQNGSTCFSFSVGNWIFVGLDSAYFDESPLYMDGALFNSKGHGKEQISYLKNQLVTGKKLMLLTHHNGIKVSKNNPTINTNLWNQVLGALGNKLPDAWYWGHVHNGIVYDQDLSIFDGKIYGCIPSG